MRNIAKLGAIAGAAALLAGCQSSPFAGWGFAKSRPARANAGPAPTIVGAQLVAEGRTQLAQGQISAAVASFRLARLDASTAAEAENGLGVAYAKLGRADLADRYFRAAIERDPTDMRFTANLLRLQQRVLMASRAAAAARAQFAESRVEGTGNEERLASNSTVHRATRGEFRIATRGDLQSAPIMTVAYREAPRKAEPAEEEAGTEAEAKAPPALAAADRAGPKEYVFPQ